MHDNTYYVVHITAWPVNKYPYSFCFCVEERAKTIEQSEIVVVRTYPTAREFV